MYMISIFKINSFYHEGQKMCVIIVKQTQGMDTFHLFWARYFRFPFIRIRINSYHSVSLSFTCGKVLVKLVILLPISLPETGVPVILL